MARIAARMLLLTSVFCLTACGEDVVVHAPPAPAIPALSPDARAVKSVRDQLANIETTYGASSDAILNFFNQMARGEIDEANRDSVNADFTSNLRMGQTILAQSANLQVPAISDPVAQGYIAQAIAAHKAWARDLLRRDAALFSDHPNIERTKHFKDAADADASQEAATLALAYHAVNLKIE